MHELTYTNEKKTNSYKGPQMHIPAYIKWTLQTEDLQVNKSEKPTAIYKR